VVAESIRDELEVADEARALATQARASAAVVALAPVGFAVFVAPVRAGGFLGSGAGILIMVVGLLLDALGLWWMWRLSGPSR
jgi:Flp pilus assembly protein TadB